MFWNKIPAHSLSRTVWNDLPTTSVDVTQEIERLDELFSIGTKPVAPVPDAKQNGRKASPTTLLDLTRAQNVSIVLTRIKVPFPELRTAILQCDENKLSVDNLKSIKACLPTTEELELVRDYEGNIATLSKADQFFKEMLGIPRLSERLACMVYMRKFELDIEELKPDLRILKHAVDEINASTKFKSVLHTVLTIGNVLNSSTFRGEASGFQLSDLLKLKDTKPSSPTPATPSLLHYLVRVLNKTDKGLVGFLDDCSHVEAAARLSTTSVMASITALIAGHDTVKEEMAVLQRIGISSQSDRFVDVTAEFLRQSSPQIKALQLAGSTVQGSLTKLLGYFGEDPAQTKPEDFSDWSAASVKQLCAPKRIRSRPIEKPNSKSRRSRKRQLQASLVDQDSAFESRNSDQKYAALSLREAGRRNWKSSRRSTNLHPLRRASACRTTPILFRRRMIASSAPLLLLEQAKPVDALTAVEASWTRRSRSCGRVTMLLVANLGTCLPPTPPRLLHSPTRLRPANPACSCDTPTQRRTKALKKKSREKKVRLEELDSLLVLYVLVEEEEEIRFMERLMGTRMER